jgi:general secretion pathway protein M
MTLLTTLRTQVVSRWQTLSPREQGSISILGAVLGLALFWSVAIAPARQTLEDSNNRRAQVEQQQAQMLALQAQAQALKARTSFSREEALRSLQSLPPNPQIQLQVQGDRVAVQLKAVPAPVLATWLAQARQQAQALPTEAHLTRASTSAALATTVVWDGALVLSLPNRVSTGK